MKTITFFCYWSICWGVLRISVVLCLRSVPHSHLSNRLTVYVDCNDGNDTANCGIISSSSCKTLQFVISKRVQQLKRSAVEINIASGECNENGVLRLDNTKTKVGDWSIVGSNGTSMRSSPTIVYFSVESFNSVISFSHLKWRNSSDTVSFNIHMSKVTFHHCILDDVNLQFASLNTNLIIQYTDVNNCTSQNQDIPLFFMQTLYNYNASVLIRNSTFSYNKSPIIYAMLFQEIFMEGNWFYKNGKNVISNSSLVTVSAASVILKNSTFSHSLGTVFELKNVKYFMAINVLFLLNNGGPSGSCLLVNRHSNVSLVDTSFMQNTNPVVFVKNDDGVNILLETSNFDCIKHKEEMNLPFLKAPDGANITATNCTTAKSCLVHCKSGELVKSNLYCQKCEPGSFSYNQNIILSDSCHSCPAGTYASHAGSMNCSWCTAGTYAPKSGYKVCKKCTNDFFTSDAGAKSCSKLTLETILIMAATIPLIVIPLFLLLGRLLLQKRSLKLKAQLQCGKKYDRFQPEHTVTTNAEKDFISQDIHSSY